MDSRERIKQPFTLRGLVAELADRGLKVDYRMIWKAVHRAGYSFNKKPAFADEQLRPDVARRRSRRKRHQGRIDPARLVFLDEISAKTNMALDACPEAFRAVRDRLELTVSF